MRRPGEIDLYAVTNGTFATGTYTVAIQPQDRDTVTRAMGPTAKCSFIRSSVRTKRQPSVTLKVNNQTLHGTSYASGAEVTGKTNYWWMGGPLSFVNMPCFYVYNIIGDSWKRAELELGVRVPFADRTQALFSTGKAGVVMAMSIVGAINGISKRWFLVGGTVFETAKKEWYSIKKELGKKYGAKETAKGELDLIGTSPIHSDYDPLMFPYITKTLGVGHRLLIEGLVMLDEAMCDKVLNGTVQVKREKPHMCFSDFMFPQAGRYLNAGNFRARVAIKGIERTDKVLANPGKYGLTGKALDMYLLEGNNYGLTELYEVAVHGCSKERTIGKLEELGWRQIN